MHCFSEITALILFSLCFQRDGEKYAIYDGDGIHSKYPYAVNVTKELKNFHSDTTLTSSHDAEAQESGSNESLCE